jgi:hypothetical protein
LTAVVIAFQAVRLRDTKVRYNRFQLPAFDAYVYVAMAEHPSFFTVAPWGYRVLTPYLVQALSGRRVVRGFRQVTFTALLLSGALLFLFLRRLGHGEWPSLAAVAVFGLSGPVGDLLGSPFVCDPVTIVLLLSFLLALEAGAGPAPLALLAVLGILNKEIFLLLPPHAYFARSGREGWRRALAVATAVAVAMTAVFLTVRFFWEPHIRPIRAPLSLNMIPAAIDALRGDWSNTWKATLLGGLTPMALVGACRRKARPFLRRYGYLLIAMFGLPFVAWLNVPSIHPVILFGKNVLRLLSFAVPLLLALALYALDRVWPHIRVATDQPQFRRWINWLGALGLAGAVAAPWVILDPYRRVDLQGSRDGPLVLATCRESLRVASRLERGRSVAFDFDSYRYVWGVSDPARLGRMRWFLREGWGPLPHYDTGDVVMREQRARLLIPCLTPRDLRMKLLMDAAVSLRVDVYVNNIPVGNIQAAVDGQPSTVDLPAHALIRGDNLVTLAARGPVTDFRPRLRSLSVETTGNE